MALLTNINGKFSVSDAGAVRFNNAFTFPTADGAANYVLQTNGSGQLAWALNGNGDISGSGTANTVTKFTGAKTVGNGPITFSGNNSTFAGDITIGPKSNASITTSESGGATTKLMSASVGRSGTFSNHEYHLMQNSAVAVTIDVNKNVTFEAPVWIPDYIYHVGDPDTYFGFSAANEFLLVAGGSNKFAADVNAAYMYYQGGVKLQTTSTGVTVNSTVSATSFLGDLNGTINTVTTATTKGNSTNDTTVATTAFVQNVVGTIPAGLVFQGTWNASTNSPTLTSGSGTTGHFYIVSVAGSTNLDGITDWQVGDWAVFIEQGASDQWEKIDNSSVLGGSGTGGSFAGWLGSGTSVTLGNAPVTFSGNNSAFIGHIAVEDGNNFYGANAIAASSEDGNYVASFGKSTSGSAKFAGNITVGAGNSTFAGTVRTNGYLQVVNPSAEIWIGDSLSGTDGGFIKWNSTHDYLYIGNSYSSAYNENIKIDNTGVVTLSDSAQYHKIQTFYSGSYTSGFKFSDYNGGIWYDAGSDDLTLNAGHANSQMLLNSGGAIALTLDASQNATFAGTIVSDNIAVGLSDGNNSSISLTANTGNWTFTNVQASRNLEISDSDGTGTVMTIDTSGNVGIGTNSPSSKLQVSGDAYVTEEFGQGVAIANKVTTYGAEFRSSGASAQVFFGRSGNDIGSGAIGADSSYVFRVWKPTDFSQPFVIEQGGNVGIGTTSPDSKLDVKGTSATPADGNQTLSITNSTGGTQLNLGTAENSYGWIEAREGSTLRNLLINPNGGNVGIGVTDPDAKLEIKGTGASTGLTFKTTDSSDNEIFYIKDGGVVGVRYYPFKIGVPSGTANVANTRFQIATTGGDFVVLNDGKTGIGTASPGAQLHNYSTATTNVFMTGHGTAAQNNWGAQNCMFVKTDNGLLISKANAANNTNRIFNFYNDANGYAELYMHAGATANVKIQASGNSYFNGGNVGIGTTHPDSKLEVITSGTNSVLELDNSNTNYTVIQYNASGATKGFSGFNAGFMLFGGEAGTTLRLQSGGSYAATILENGNFGIGLTDPEDRLQIDHPGNPTAIRIGDNTTDDCYVIFNTDGNDWSIGTDRSDSNKFKISDYSRVGTNDRLVIDTSGNVGIGSNTPLANLDIGNDNGSIYQRWSYDNPGANNYFLSLSETVTSGNVRFCFNQRNAGTNYDNVLVFNQGNVGIGTDSPSYKLHVDSDVASGDVCFIHHDNPSQSSGTVMKIRSDAGDNGGSALLNVENNTGNALYVRGDRNVGIGTTSPVAMLQAGSLAVQGAPCHHVGIGLSNTELGSDLQPLLTVKGNISYGYNNYSSVANTWSNALNFSGYPAGLYQVNICKQSNASAYIIAQVKWSGTAGTVINTVTSFQYGITFSGTQLQSIINTTTATSISVQCLVTFESCLP